MNKPLRTDKAIILNNGSKKYHLCTKFGIDADNIINYFKNVLPKLYFSIMTREEHILTQWNNRKELKELR